MCESNTHTVQCVPTLCGGVILKLISVPKHLFLKPVYTMPCAITIHTVAQTAVREVQEETGIQTGMATIIIDSIMSVTICTVCTPVCMYVWARIVTCMLSFFQNLNQ